MPAPAVVVLHEVFRVNADIRKTCVELAEQGFIAFAPDLFWRQEPGIDLSVTSEPDWQHGLRLYQAYDRDAGGRDIKETGQRAQSSRDRASRLKAVFGAENHGLRACVDHTLITPIESVGSKPEIGTTSFRLECATYNWFVLPRTGRNGFDSRWRYDLLITHCSHHVLILLGVWRLEYGSRTRYLHILNATPKIPFWLMVFFKDIRLYFLGSDDFPEEARVAATPDLNDALQAGWAGFEIGARIPLAEIARAHEPTEYPVQRGARCGHGMRWITQSDEGNRPLP